MTEGVSLLVGGEKEGKISRYIIIQQEKVCCFHSLIEAPAFSYSASCPINKIRRGEARNYILWICRLVILLWQ